MAIRNLTETLVIDKASNVNYTRDGYMTAAPRIARTGIQLYYGSELGLTGQDSRKVMKVYRPESEVFDQTSLSTFAYKPMTDDHPPVPVTADNWKDYATGQLSGDVLRDGEYIRIPMALMDKKAVQKFKDGKAELSVGYTCDIAMTAGTAPDGTQYDAVQSNITANHVAVVDAARGGAALRIGDGAASSIIDRATIIDAVSAISNGKLSLHDKAPEGSRGVAKAKDGKVEFPFFNDGTVYMSDLLAAQTSATALGDADILAAINAVLSFIDRSHTVDDHSKGRSPEGSKAMKTMVIDGITVQVGDGNDGEIIQRHIRTLSDSVTDLTGRLTTATTTHNTVVAAKDGEIAKLTTDLATASTKVTTLESQLKDAVVTPAKLDALVADRKVVADKARFVMGDKASTLVIDGKTDDEIRSQVVTAKLGDAAKGWSADQVKVSFDTLTAGIDLTKLTTTDGRGGVLDTARAFSAPTVQQNDAVDKALNDRDQRLQNAWKTAGGPTPAH